MRSQTGHYPDTLIWNRSNGSEKDLSEEAYEDLAKEVKKICDRQGIRLICHNYPAVAERLGIFTLHLPLAKLREYAACEHEKKLELGCSVHAVEEAKEAERLGVSYLVAGHIYATDCKKGLPPRGLSFLREVCSNVTVPVYAIGGIGFADGRIEEVCKCQRCLYYVRSDETLAKCWLFFGNVHCTNENNLLYLIG